MIAYGGFHALSPMDDHPRSDVPLEDGELTWVSHGVAPSMVGQPASSGIIWGGMSVHDGHVWLPYGDWNANSGPIDVLSWDIEAEEYVVHLADVPTHGLGGLRVRSDGKLFTAWLDGGATGGGYSSNKSGVWANYPTVPGNLHTLDVLPEDDGTVWVSGATSEDVGAGLTYYAIVLRQQPDSSEWEVMLKTPAGAGSQGRYGALIPLPLEGQGGILVLASNGLPHMLWDKGTNTWTPRPFAKALNVELSSYHAGTVGGVTMAFNTIIDPVTGNFTNRLWTSRDRGGPLSMLGNEVVGWLPNHLSDAIGGVEYLSVPAGLHALTRYTNGYYSWDFRSSGPRIFPVPQDVKFVVVDGRRVWARTLMYELLSAELPDGWPWGSPIPG